MRRGTYRTLNALLVASLITGLAGTPVAVAAEQAAEQVPAEPPSVGKLLSVRKHGDGSVTGRLMVHYVTGKSEPAEAKILVAKHQSLITTAVADERGRFELVGLAPGEYTATAELRSGTIEFPVTVLPHYAEATADEMQLNATLTPMADGGLVMTEGIVLGDCGGCGECELCLAQPPMMCPMATCGECCCEESVGGYGGGGHGGGLLGPALGIAGLVAGITALATRDRDERPVSPFEL